jgi:tetratricopeptide (TPR) repeat protein
MDDQSNNVPDNDWSRAEELATQAHALYDEGRLTEAAEQLQAAIDLYPYHSAWHFNLGLTYEALDEIDSACECFRAALDLDESDIECLNCLAGGLTRLGKFTEALQCYERIDAIDPNFEPGFCNRIATYTEMGDHENAELAFYMARQLKDRCSICSYNLGSSYFLRGRYDEAVLSWTETLRIEPTHALANVRLAEVNWLRGNTPQACEHYRAQLRITGEDVDIRLDFVDLLIEAGMFEEARYQLSVAEKFEPENPGVHQCLGDLARAEGDLDLAEVDYRKAMALNPMSASSYAKLARLLLAKGEGGDAVVLLSRGVKHVVVDPVVLHEFSQIFLAAGATPQAYILLSQLVDLSPMDASAWHNLGVTCLQQGWTKEGIRHCRHALRLRPGYALARYNLARGYATNGQPRRAMAQVRCGLREAPENQRLLELKEQLDTRQHRWRRWVGRLGQLLRRR